MDDKSEMKDEREEKDSSSANGDRVSSQGSEEGDYAAATQDQNDPVRVLQLSQPFFVADTLEEDESMIIPPTQEDSVPFMIPSTPTCTDKSERRSEQLEQNQSTIAILEETCVDLENKTDHNDTRNSNDYKVNTTCNESDLTEDISELDTQPIIPFRDDDEENADKKEEDSSTKKDPAAEQEEDDEWQLKFSETQTQDLLNLEKYEEENNDKETKEETSKEAQAEEKAEDSLPETCTINLEDTPKIEDKNSSNSSSSVKIIETKEGFEEMDTQSDDEIEPSQSCLSEYKGETISTTFKISPSTEAQCSEVSIEKFPKTSSESENIKENSTNDIQIIEDIQEKENVITGPETKSTLDVESNVLDPKKSTSVERALAEDKKKVDEVRDSKGSSSDINGLKESNKPDDTGIEEIYVVEEPKNQTSEKASDEAKVEVKKAEEIKSVEISEEDSVENMEINEDKSKNKTHKQQTKTERLKPEDNVSESKHNKSITELKPDDRITEIKSDDSVIELKSNETRSEELKVDKNTDIAKIKEIVNEEPKIEENAKEVAQKSGNNTEIIEDEGKIIMTESQKDKNNKAEKLKVCETDKSEIIETVDANENSDLAKQEKKKDIKTKNSGKNQADLSKTVKAKVDSGKSKPAKTAKPELVTKSDVTKGATPVAIDSDSKGNQCDKKQIEDVATTPPTFLLPPLPSKSPWRGLGSARKQKVENKHIYPSSLEKYEKPNISIGMYKNIKSLEKCLKSIGITLDHEKLEMILSKPEEEITIRNTITLVDHQMILKEYSIEVEHHHREAGISPISSSSTTTSSSLSLKASIHSGEMADISTTSSSGKSNSCGIQLESAQSINFLSSQEGADNFPKTSTQKSQEPTGFSEVFGVKESSGNTKTDPSPIKPDQTVKTGAAKRKKGGKKNNESSSSETSNTVEPKRKRGRITKTKQPVEEKIEDSEESKDAPTEVKPVKATRRKKGATAVAEKVQEDNKSIKEDFEMPNDDDSGQEEANFGSILPGVKVMARWKDGYYYSGMVQSQELDGKWAVLFEDGFLRTIAPENLIKIAILPKGTSVLVQSPDDYYDPGIVCGHYREGNKFGYEVELDNGVTKRYPRSAVILSGDQAKLITSNRPPTTPASMTINLDNIIDGKRKRKSVQSPATSPVVKKSPRITRSKKPDSNLDSTAESSAMEVMNFKETEIEEDPVVKKRKPRKGTKTSAVAAAASNDSNSSNGKRTTKILPQRSAKIFKDYAFLLTNADRKIIPKSVEASDSESGKAEEEDIVPFDKDELCSYIVSGGGLILEKFDDIKKCTRKHIYLLANSFLRTMKYIQCIAAGISCIKHHWVQNCVFKGEILSLNSYILPSGFSLVTQCVIEWHGKTDVFKGLKIALVSAPESPFVYTWAPVLLAAKADFVQKWNLPSSVSGCHVFVDVLITNSHCPTEIINSAKKKKIPIVSSEWIIQCLIMGERLPYDAHQKFRYNYTEV